MKDQRILWIAVSVLLTLVVGCTGGPTGPLALVENYEQIVNAHNPEDTIALFAEENARLVFMGDITFYDREEILGYIAYDCGLEAIYKFENCAAEELSVTCDAILTDDLGKAAGWGGLHYSPVVFSFTETGLIQKMVLTGNKEEQEASFALFSEFIPWVESERPDEFEVLFGTTGFNFSEANGRLILDLMNQWQAERE